MLAFPRDSVAVDVPVADIARKDGAVYTKNTPTQEISNRDIPSCSNDVPSKDALTIQFLNEGAATAGSLDVDLAAKDGPRKASHAKGTTCGTITRVPTLTSPLPSPTPTSPPASPNRSDPLVRIRLDFDSLSETVYSTFRAIESLLTFPSPTSPTYPAPSSKDAYRASLKSYTSLSLKVRDTQIKVTTRIPWLSAGQAVLKRNDMIGESEVVGLWLSCLQVWSGMLEDVLTELEDEIILLEGGV